MDDLFGDLVPARPAVVSVAEETKTNGTTDTPLKPLPSADEASAGVMLTVSKADLEQLLSTSVQAAVDLTFGKFAKSLRTVLEDMSKRIEAQEKAQVQISSELKETLRLQGELLARQAESSNARFTSLDMSIRELDRGLQAMRDKQELQEAQALLAKFSGGSSKVAAEQPQATATSTAASPSTAPAPAPAAAPAPAVASPVAASAPAPAQPMPASAPYSAPQLRQPQVLPSPGLHAGMGMPASAPAAQYQEGYQQQGPPQHMLPQQQQQQQQQPGPEPQYAPQPAYAYRAPEGMPPTQPHQLGGGEQYQHMMPMQQQPLQQQPLQQQPLQQQPLQQQQQQPLQHQHQPLPQQQQQPQQMAPNYGQLPQFQPMQPQMQQAPRPAPVQTMQGPLPPDMAPHMPGANASMYPAARMPTYPTLGPQRTSPYQQPMPMPPAAQAAPAPLPKTTSRAVPLEQIITDITNMGFERHQVMALVNNLQKSGQAVDLNMIIDKLTRGDYQ